MKPIAPTDYLSPYLAETNGASNDCFTGISLELLLWLQKVWDHVAKQNSLSFYSKRMDQKTSLDFFQVHSYYLDNLQLLLLRIFFSCENHAILRLAEEEKNPVYSMQFFLRPKRYNDQTGIMHPGQEPVFILCPKFPEEPKMLLLSNFRLLFALRILVNEPDTPCAVQLGKAPGLVTPSLPVLPIHFSDMLSVFSFFLFSPHYCSIFACVFGAYVAFFHCKPH